MTEFPSGKICYKTKIDAQFALYCCQRTNQLNGNNNRHEKMYIFVNSVRIFI